MKKILAVIIIFLVMTGATVVLFFTPFKKYVENIPYFKEIYNNTQLNINTRRGKYEVSVDGKSYGETPLKQEGLPEGQHSVTLKRTVDNSFYKSHDFLITFTKDTETFMDMEIGPDDVISGYILYYTSTPQTNTSSGYITIMSDNDCSVYLDGEYLGKTPIKAKMLNKKEYQLKVASKGFETQEFPVIIRDSFNLNVKVYLMPVPVNFE